MTVQEHVHMRAWLQQDRRHVSHRGPKVVITGWSFSLISGNNQWRDLILFLASLRSTGKEGREEGREGERGTLATKQHHLITDLFLKVEPDKHNQEAHTLQFQNFPSPSPVPLIKSSNLCAFCRHTWCAGSFLTHCLFAGIRGKRRKPTGKLGPGLKNAQLALRLLEALKSALYHKI